MADELKQPTIPSENKYVTEEQGRDLFNSMLTNYSGLMRVQANQIQSGNYSANSVGWALKSDGSIDVSSGSFRGKIEIRDNSGNIVILLDPNG